MLRATGGRHSSDGHGTRNRNQVHLAAVGAPPEIFDLDIDDEHTLSTNTGRAYDKAWRSFDNFCDSQSLEPLPAHPEVMQ